jgi:hypothetical protein
MRRASAPGARAPCLRDAIAGDASPVRGVAGHRGASALAATGAGTRAAAASPAPVPDRAGRPVGPGRSAPRRRVVGGTALAGLALVALLAAPGPGRAQDTQARPEAAEPLPPEPPPAPPAPPRLATEGAAQAQPASPAGPPLPPGMAALPEGGVRLMLSGAAPDAAQAAALATLARAFAALPAGRITVEAQVSGPANDASMARRASLARAQAVKAALVAGGLPPTRIDLRPLGRLAAGVDRVDVLPPGVASPNAEARGR